MRTQTTPASHRPTPLERSSVDRHRKVYRLTPLRALRLASGLTLSAVANRASIPLVRASRIETGLQTATDTEIQALRGAIRDLSSEAE